jgi:hypothetical protein
MSDAKKKVLDMVEKKRITAAEGDALLAAMRTEKRSALKLLVDPYGRLSTGAMLAAGAIVAAASVFLAVALDLRFDGFMDIHNQGTGVPPLVAVADQVIAWPLAALALWLVALPFARGCRLVDVLAVSGIARVPIAIAGALLAPLAPSPEEVAAMSQRAAGGPGAILGDLVSMLPMIAVALVFLAWAIALSAFGFRHAAGLRGGKLAAAFVLALLVAEIASKAAVFGVDAIL